jgi:hypothetical protein
MDEPLIQRSKCHGGWLIEGQLCQACESERKGFS